MGITRKWIVIMRPVLVVVWSFALASVFVSAERSFMKNGHLNEIDNEFDEPDVLLKIKNFLWQPGHQSYHHVWPVSILELICACVCVFVVLIYIFTSLSFMQRNNFHSFFSDNVQDLLMHISPGPPGLEFRYRNY